MKPFIMFCLLSIALIGCSADQSTPSLNKEVDAIDSNNVDIDPKRAPEPEQITLFLEDEEKRFYLKDLPLIQKYVQTSSNPELEVARMRIQELENSLEETSLYMLRYACEAKLCSHMLIKETKKNIQTMLVSDLSQFREATFSPDQKKLLLTFSINEGNEVTREKISVVNIKNLQPVPLTLKDEMDLNFGWPILAATWTSGESIEVSVPDLDDSSFESIKFWHQSSPETRRQRAITITLDN